MGVLNKKLTFNLIKYFIEFTYILFEPLQIKAKHRAHAEIQHQHVKMKISQRQVQMIKNKMCAFNAKYLGSLSTFTRSHINY